jgi:homoserine dehydrogenase
MINIGILGNGTVGKGVVELIDKNRESIKKRTGTDLHISSILVQNLEKHRKNEYFPLITNNNENFFDKDMDIVVEVIGGVHPAYDYIKKALNSKKHVVTANKNVISKHGVELLELAKKQVVSLSFEASVGGGMPIIKMLSDGLTGNNIDSITGILNGTTNFILSKMANENMDYEAALIIAQELGFAEADPSSDVLGQDAARKLAIASSISYGEIVDYEKILTEGITHIDGIDMLCAKELGCTIKLLALSKKDKDKVYAAVRPTILPRGSSLGKIENEFNGVILDGDAVGEIFLSGKVAGSLPTASAVMADILAVAGATNQKVISFGSIEAEIESQYNNKASWLLRIKCRERGKILSAITSGFGKAFIFNNKGKEDDEIIAYVEGENEKFVDAFISNISDENEVINVKKILSLDNIKPSFLN